jgi:hypothetical protein
MTDEQLREAITSLLELTGQLGRNMDVDKVLQERTTADGLIQRAAAMFDDVRKALKQRLYTNRKAGNGNR